MDALSKLSVAINDPQTEIKDKLKKVCEFTMEAVPLANRVSIWTFLKCKTEMHCLMCFDAYTNEVSSGQVLIKTDFVDYFRSLLANNVVNAPDARIHPDTRCFNEKYFEPNNIYSLLDYIYDPEFEPCGVICCESVGRKVTWVSANVDSLREIAKLSSQFFKH
ncbi:hypothetical protein [Pseudoalteromonas denitrificans]|uniref:GAF domain-containing protein n=1 Tax=Pseudoalteromonas denitrificans DSM 6059 TaxID=1123010 RepID=A0A1I1U7T8_9GAMM|nr:hypothetical protein [Pseudoalteromonas denitrificans]SFD66839.1 hypothetical protein SAMN02745724_05141 [Pseudoalteromonas denitrificans DSM 6059]